MKTGDKELEKEKNLKIITRNVRHYPEKSLLSEFSLKLADWIYITHLRSKLAILKRKPKAYVKSINPLEFL